MRKILYTCVTPGYDVVVDQPLKPDDWELKIFTGLDSTLSPQRQARRIKICPYLFFEYDVCMWFDGNLQLLDPAVFTLTDDLVLLRHPTRLDVYEEADACKRQYKAPLALINKQVKYYRSLGMPVIPALPATGMVFRRNTEQVRVFCDAWWEQISKFTARDQLSFNFVAWQQAMPFTLIDFDQTLVKIAKHKISLRFTQPVMAVQQNSINKTVPVPDDRRKQAIMQKYKDGAAPQLEAARRRLVHITKHGITNIPAHLIIPRVRRVSPP